MYEFEEKCSELNSMLNILHKATDQVKTSQKFKNTIEVNRALINWLFQQQKNFNHKLIQLILVIGNHLNKGSPRLGEANAFKLNVLPQLDQTKLNSESNSPINLLNLLARLCEKQYPDSLNLRHDFQSIEQASKSKSI